MIDVAAAFDAVADGGTDGRKRLGDLPIMVQQGGFGVDVSGRTDLFGDGRRRHVFTIEFAVSIIEEIHKEGRLSRQVGDVQSVRDAVEQIRMKAKSRGRG